MPLAAASPSSGTGSAKHRQSLLRSTAGAHLLQAAGLIFIVGLAGVGLNFWADKQRQTFRELDGKCLIWGAEPVFVKAAYNMVDARTGPSPYAHRLDDEMRYRFESCRCYLDRNELSGRPWMFESVFAELTGACKTHRYRHQCIRQDGAEVFLAAGVRLVGCGEAFPVCFRAYCGTSTCMMTSSSTE